MAVFTIIKAFIDQHPLRGLFLILFFVGSSIGYFRYWMRVKGKEMQRERKFLRYGFLLLFIIAYMVIKYGVRTLVSHEVSSQDYGIVIAFFILGLFIAYYGLYSFYLWRKKE